MLIRLLYSFRTILELITPSWKRKNKPTKERKTQLHALTMNVKPLVNRINSRVLYLNSKRWILTWLNLDKPMTSSVWAVYCSCPFALVIMLLQANSTMVIAWRKCSTTISNVRGESPAYKECGRLWRRQCHWMKCFMFQHVCVIQNVVYILNEPGYWFKMYIFFPSSWASCLFSAHHNNEPFKMFIFDLLITIFFLLSSSNRPTLLTSTLLPSSTPSSWFFLSACYQRRRRASTSFRSSPYSL